MSSMLTKQKIIELVGLKEVDVARPISWAYDDATISGSPVNLGRELINLLIDFQGKEPLIMRDFVKELESYVKSKTK